MYHSTIQLEAVQFHVEGYPDGLFQRDTFDGLLPIDLSRRGISVEQYLLENDLLRYFEHLQVSAFLIGIHNVKGKDGTSAAYSRNSTTNFVVYLACFNSESLDATHPEHGLPPNCSKSNTQNFHVFS
eukprot:scaffold103_cov193-Alexandrium_tamarense.AAC.10